MAESVMPRVSWVASHTTDQVLPINILDANAAAVTNFEVAVVAHNAPDPEDGDYTAAVEDDGRVGPRIVGLPRGLYVAHARAGGEWVTRVPFKLT